MRPADLLDLILDLLPTDGRVAVGDRAVAAALRDLRPALTVDVWPLDEELTAEGARGVGPATGGSAAEGSLDAAVLVSGEVARAGERGPTVIDAAVRACRPGGWVAVAVPSAMHQVLAGGDGSGGMTAAAVSHALAERGLDVRRMLAPGAGARLAGREWRRGADLDLDSTPGLLDAGEVILAVARTPKTSGERSRLFFASIARKIVSASVLCVTPDRRLLVVFDSFKQAWTLPGGLVDADESPVDAAVREAHEEGGVEVLAGDLLGIFAHSTPDRINLVYGATPVNPPDRPVPVHDHEIAEVRWVPLAAAAEQLDGWWPRKVACCVEDPGRTWHW